MMQQNHLLSTIRAEATDVYFGAYRKNSDMDLTEIENFNFSKHIQQSKH